MIIFSYKINNLQPKKRFEVVIKNEHFSWSCKQKSTYVIYMLVCIFIFGKYIGRKCMEVTNGVSKFNYATLLQHLVI